MGQPEPRLELVAARGRWPVAGALVCGVLLLGWATRLASQSSPADAGAEGRSIAAYARITQLAAILVAATDAESCSHGFIVTGDYGFLSPFDRALEVQAEELAQLELQYAGDRERAPLLRDVRDALAAQREHMTRMVALRRSMGEGAAPQLLANFRGRELTDSVRAAVKVLINDEQAALRSVRVRTASAASAGTRAWLIFACAGVMALSLGSFALIRKRRRRKAIAGWEPNVAA